MRIGWGGLILAVRERVPFWGDLDRAKLVEVLHVDASKVRFYETEDLDYLSKVLADIFDDLIIERSHWAAPENAGQTKTRLAVALFACAETGERDSARLKRKALAALDVVKGPCARRSH